jgi:predicted PurR-regulated permease PerM
VADHLTDPARVRTTKASNGSDERDTDPSVIPPGWNIARATRGVPVSTIVTAVVIVLGTIGFLRLLSHTTTILTLVLISMFFAVVLTPPVDLLVKRLHFKRAMAAALVFIVGLATIGLLGYLFIKPLAEQGTSFANNLPTYVRDAQNGKGAAGKLVKRYKLDDWLDKNKDELQKRAQTVFEPKQVLGVAVGTVGTVFSTVAAVLTVAVLTFLMLLEGPPLLLSATRILHEPAQERVKRVGRLCARAVTGYVNGNLAISVIAGLTTWIFLLIAGVPFAGVLALWVAFADLIPLVGATLGAIPAIAVAFLHSTPVGIATLIFYVVYQQIENQILQPTIMARTVALKPLVVLLSVLFGVELFGLLGALLAIPVAGIIKVLASDILAHRRPDLVEIDDGVKHRRWFRRDKPTDGADGSDHAPAASMTPTRGRA